MKKILSLSIALYFCFSFAAAQNTEELKEFSESLPYEPRPVEMTDPKKKKKSKNESKNSNDKKNAPVEAPVLAISKGSARTIRIPVFVYDRQNKPVTDLGSADFKVFVDDSEVSFVSLESAQTARSILLIVDTSPSLAYQEKDLRNAVTRLIEALKPDDKIQIISFNSEIKVLSEMTNDAAILQKAVKKLGIGDGTSIYEAVREIFGKHLASQTERPIVVLLTDGVDTTSRKASYATSLVEAERSGAVVFPFYFDSFEYAKKSQIPIPPNSLLILGLPRSGGVTEAEYEVGRFYVQDLAALSGGKSFAIKSFADVKKEDFEAALKFMRPHYYVSFETTESAAGFQRKKLKVRINRPNLIVASRGSLVTGVN